MADTEKTLAQLQTLLRNNGLREISAQDIRDAILATVLGGWASIHVEDGSTSQGSLVQYPGSQVKLTAFSANGAAAGFTDSPTPDHTNDQITVAADGKYRAELSVSFNASTGVTAVFGVLKNASRVAGITGEASVANNTQRRCVSCHGTLDLVATDTVSAWVALRDTISSQTITVRQANLAIKRIG